MLLQLILAGSDIHQAGDIYDEGAAYDAIIGSGCPMSGPHQHGGGEGPGRGYEGSGNCCTFDNYCEDVQCYSLAYY